MMIASVVIFENYSASYTSFLSVVQMEEPFKSVLELYSKTGFNIGSMKGSAYRTNFEVFKFSFDSWPINTLQNGGTFNVKVANERWLDVDDMKAGIEEAKQSKFAFITASQSVYGLMGKSCEVVEMGPNIVNGILVMIWQKDFPYAPLFNY